MLKICIALGLMAQPHGDASQALVDYLSFIDVPMTSAEIHRRGGTKVELEELARDANQKRYVRMRAASALAFLPGRATQTVLMALVDDRALDAEVRIQAMSAFRALAGEDARTHLSRWLEAPHVELRAASIRNIGHIGAEHLLESRLALKAETSPRLIDLMRRTIASRPPLLETRHP